MNMFIHELKAYRKSTIIWTISLIAIMGLFLSFFPSIARDADDFKKLLDGYPEEIKKAIGFTVESITSILGYYSYVFLYIALCGSIQAMNIGTSILSKEVREKTADFLLTKPVTRINIMTQKLLAALTQLVITNIVYLLASFIMVSNVAIDDFSYKTFFMVSITLFFLQLIFLALGVIVSIILPKIKSVIPISLGSVFTFFIISMIGSSKGEEAIRYITPFQYFNAPYIIKNSSYETSYMIVGIVFIIIAIAASYVIYSRKDVHAV